MRRGLISHPKLNKLNGRQQCCFAQTSVCQGSAGDIEALQNAQDLRKVDLSQLNVSGDIILGLGNAKKLKYLDISHTSVGGNLSALQLNQLETFKASGCHLKGSFIGNSFPSLLSLDLRSTQIVRIDNVPSQCLTMQLADIVGMSFAPGVLSYAAKNMVFVDLRNVTFTDPSESWPWLSLWLVFIRRVSCKSGRMRMPLRCWTVAQ